MAEQLTRRRKAKPPKVYLHGAELREGNDQPWFADFAERAERVVDFAFGGMHHVFSARFEDGHLWCSVYGSLSTWDFDGLTRLVVAAHEHCVRIDVRPSAPRHLGILISRRVPLADAGTHPMVEGHPTLLEHLEKLKRPIAPRDDVCWHCLDVLEPQGRPHCNACPPDGDCDDAECTEPGCEGDDRG